MSKETRQTDHDAEQMYQNATVWQRWDSQMVDNSCFVDTKLCCCWPHISIDNNMVSIAPVIILEV